MRNECSVLKFALLCFPKKEKGRKKIRIGKGEPRETKSSNPQIILNPPGTYIVLAAAAKSLQSCPTLYDPMDGSPPGSPVSGILQARTLE